MIMQTKFYIYLIHKCQFMETAEQNMMKKAPDPTNVQWTYIIKTFQGPQMWYIFKAIKSYKYFGYIY
jgi:hypothetical protein